MGKIIQHIIEITLVNWGKMNLSPYQWVKGMSVFYKDQTLKNLHENRIEHLSQFCLRNERVIF